MQDALRGVVRAVLCDAERDGLMGDHHFYIAFKTRAPGVSLPEHLKDRFPDEMTIVLQHKFWGLKVCQDYFEVGLSFDRKPELLVIPFSAVVGFVDPSVQFALQFNDDSDMSDADIAADDLPPSMMDDTDHDNDAPTEGPSDGAPEDKTADGSNVVTLDAFRKK